MFLLWQSVSIHSQPYQKATSYLSSRWPMLLDAAMCASYGNWYILWSKMFVANQRFFIVVSCYAAIRVAFWCPASLRRWLRDSVVPSYNRSLHRSFLSYVPSKFKHYIASKWSGYLSFSPLFIVGVFWLNQLDVNSRFFFSYMQNLNLVQHAKAWISRFSPKKKKEKT